VRRRMLQHWRGTLGRRRRTGVIEYNASLRGRLAERKDAIAVREPGKASGVLRSMP
jgi:hypothetical protein